MAMTKSEGGRWYVISSSDNKVIPWKQIPDELYGALCKLHDYELTGLDPDAVERLVDENKQLKKLLAEIQSIIEG